MKTIHFFLTTSIITTAQLQIYESTTVPLLYSLFPMIHQEWLRSLHFTFSDSAVTVVAVTIVVVTAVATTEADKIHMILQ